MIKAGNTIGGYIVELDNKKVFVKQNPNEDYYRAFLYEEKPGEVEENSKKEIELTPKEWGQVMMYIQILREKGIGGVICTLLEGIGGEEKVIKSRIAMFWQLRDNWLRFR